MKDLRKAFFRTIIEARDVLESENRSPIIRNLPTGEWLRGYREYVGMFLLGVEAITLKDYELAQGMIESFEDRLDERGK